MSNRALMVLCLPGELDLHLRTSLGFGCGSSGSKVASSTKSGIDVATDGTAFDNKWSVR